METPNDLEKLPEDNDVLLSEIVDSVKKNYAIAYGNRITLESLQSWVRQQSELYKDRNEK